MNERGSEARSPERAGQMTQVMRAAARAAAPKVLRIAMVQRGVVVDERVAEKGAAITVGPTERATFVVASSALAPSHRLFEPHAGGYRLNLLEGMRGRIATSTGVVDLPSTRARQLSLGEDARGKVVVGDATFLFQFVEARPPRGAVPLPISARANLASAIDWTTTIVAALSFLLHFGLIASLYGDWLDPTVDDDVVVGRVIETVRALPAPPAVEHRDAPVDHAAATSTAEATRAPSVGTTRGSGKRSESKGPGSGAKMTDTRAHEISAELRAINIAMTTALNGGGPSTSQVLAVGGDIPTDLLNAAAKSEAGAGRGGVPGLDTGGSAGGVIRPGGGGGDRSLASIGDTHRKTAESAGSAVAVDRPHGVAQIAPPEPKGGEVPGAPGVVAGMAGAFRRCYNAGLAREDPTMHGSLRVIARIGPNGDVLSTTATPANGNLSATVIACVANRVASAKFSPPTNGGATLVIPATFLLP